VVSGAEQKAEEDKRREAEEAEKRKLAAEAEKKRLQEQDTHTKNRDGRLSNINEAGGC